MKTVLDTNDEKPAEQVITYKVTVEKVVKNFPFRNREYKKLSSDEEDETYAYVYFDDTKTIESEVYTQEVETIDLPAVIKAVNGMDEIVITGQETTPHVL